MKGHIAGYDLRKPVWRPAGLLRIVIVVAVAGAMWYFGWQRQQNRPQPKPAQGPPATVTASRPAEAPPKTPREPAPELARTAPTSTEPVKSVVTPRTTILDRAIYDQLGNEVFRGDIDLRPTLDRIADGRKLGFTSDGAVFQNRERRLPMQPEGYYREYVHPTPGLSGPGPQRIVVGERGEAFYTPDHYRTFRRVDGG